MKKTGTINDIISGPHNRPAPQPQPRRIIPSYEHQRLFSSPPPSIEEAINWIRHKIPDRFNEARIRKWWDEVEGFGWMGPDGNPLSCWPRHYAVWYDYTYGSKKSGKGSTDGAKSNVAAYNPKPSANQAPMREAERNALLKQFYGN